MTFAECVGVCAAQPGFLAQLDRLRGTNFSRWHRRADNAIGRMVDDATGANRPTEAEMAEFSVLVYDLVWCRLARASAPPAGRETP